MTYDPQRSPGSAGSADDLQFDRAETMLPPTPGGAPAPVDYGTPASAAGPAVCTACAEPITDVYFEAQGKIVCSPCRDAVAAAQAKGLGVVGFVRAVLFAAGAMVAGCAVTYAIGGRFWGILTVALGWAVGSAVRSGSGRRGGIAYQLLAVALTYVGVAAMLVPFMIRDLRESGVNVLNDPAALVAVAAVSLTAPVRVGFERVFALFALVIALVEAWQLNRATALVFNGPYRLAPT
jgi:hypothetical protein